MDLLKGLVARAIGSPKTTAGGMTIAGVVGVVWYEVIKMAHCDFSQVQYAVVASVAVPALMGLFTTDANKVSNPG